MYSMNSENKIHTSDNLQMLDSHAIIRFQHYLGFIWIQFSQLYKYQCTWYLKSSYRLNWSDLYIHQIYNFNFKKVLPNVDLRIEDLRILHEFAESAATLRYILSILQKFSTYTEKLSNDKSYKKILIE